MWLSLKKLVDRLGPLDPEKEAQMRLRRLAFRLSTQSLKSVAAIASTPECEVTPDQIRQVAEGEITLPKEVTERLYMLAMTLVWVQPVVRDFGVWLAENQGDLAALTNGELWGCLSDFQPQVEFPRVA